MPGSQRRMGAPDPESALGDWLASVGASAAAAAQAVGASLTSGDTSASALGQYESLLSRSFVGKDMSTYAKAPAFLENPRLYGEYGQLLADVMRGVFDLDASPRRHLLRTAKDALKASPLTVGTLVRDGWKGVRAL